MVVSVDLATYRINLNKRTVCYVVKNSLPWKRVEKHSKIRDVKKQKLADLTGGGNSNDIAHRSLIQVNTVLIPHYPIPTPAVIRHLRQASTPSLHPLPPPQPQKKKELSVKQGKLPWFFSSD